MFRDGEIDGVIVHPLQKHVDQRGWLIELFREDEMPTEYFPVMSYISLTNPGIARGPHEHAAQADVFGFIGPSTFKLYLWDNRKGSRTYMTKQIIEAGEKNPLRVVIPHGVVHAYKNIGSEPGMVVNYPNQLFAGKGKKEKVDEIRHESDPNSIFRLD